MQVVSDQFRLVRGRGVKQVPAGPAARLAVVAALCSLGAATIHALAAPPHLNVYRPLGAAFLVAAFAQAVWPALVLARRSRPLLLAGIAGNTAVLAAWAVSRTMGLPVGPDAGVPEPVGALDLTASLFELALIGSCAALLKPKPGAAPRPVKRFAAIVTLVIAGAVTVAVVADVRGTAQRPGAPVQAPAH